MNDSSRQSPPDKTEPLGSPSALAGLPGWAIAAGLSVEHTLDGGLQCGVDIIEIERIRAAVERCGGALP